MKNCSYCIHYDEEWGGSCELGNIEFQDFGKGCGDWSDEEDEDCGSLDDDLGIGQDEPSY